jgi:hypothetical protein
MTQSRRTTTPEGAAVIGTEVQGFRPELDMNAKRWEPQTKKSGAAVDP